MIPQLNHTEDTIIVSVAMVLAGLLVARAFNRLTAYIKGLKEAQQEANMKNKASIELWDKIPTIDDYHSF